VIRAVGETFDDIAPFGQFVREGSTRSSWGLSPRGSYPSTARQKGITSAVSWAPGMTVSVWAAKGSAVRHLRPRRRRDVASEFDVVLAHAVIVIPDRDQAHGDAALPHVNGGAPYIDVRQGAKRLE
jgi:hypothetical protein